MKFKLSNVNGHLSRYKGKLEQNGYKVYLEETNKEYDDYYMKETIYYGLFIEIESLQELKDISELLDHKMILDQCDDLIIYDGYIE